jgi:hypothetical protein
MNFLKDLMGSKSGTNFRIRNTMLLAHTAKMTGNKIKEEYIMSIAPRHTMIV